MNFTRECSCGGTAYSRNNVDFACPTCGQLFFSIERDPIERDADCDVILPGQLVGVDYRFSMAEDPRTSKCDLCGRIVLEDSNGGFACCGCYWVEKVLPAFDLEAHNRELLIQSIEYEAYLRAGAIEKRRSAEIWKEAEGRGKAA